LVGSYARGAALPDSDVDLILLSPGPDRYVADTTWTGELGSVAHLQIEHYVRASSVRVWYAGGPEVEYVFAAEDWAAVPADAGAREVVAGGLRVLFERRPLLSNLLHSLGAMR
jgi:hypothetical protein